MEKFKSYNIGISIGHKNASIYYWDNIKNEPEALDISGGYCGTNIPVAMEYIEFDSKWIISSKNSTTNIVDDLLNKLNNREEVTINDKVFRIEEIIIKFVSELISNIYYIDPYASINKVVIAVSSDSYLNFKNKINFNSCDYEVISCVEAVSIYEKEKNLLNIDEYNIIDFGHSGFKSYNIKKTDEHIRINLDEFINDFSGRKIEKWLFENLMKMCAKNKIDINKEDEMIIESMVKEYLPLVLNKKEHKKPIRVYFNLFYPPFVEELSHKIINDEICNVINNIEKFFQKQSREEVCFLMGNCFEMHWLSKVIEKYNCIKISTKNIVAYSAAYIANYGKNTTAKICKIGKKEYGVLAYKNDIKEFVPIIEIGKPISRDNGKTFIIKKENFNNEIETYIKDVKGNITIEKKIISNIKFIENINRINISFNIYEDDIFDINMEYLPL